MMMMSRMSYKSRFENGTEEQRASIEHPCVDFMGGGRAEQKMVRNNIWGSQLHLRLTALLQLF